MCIPNHKVGKFGFCKPHLHKALLEIFMILCILIFILYMNSQDAVHLVQYNLLNMDHLFQYMPCHKTNMTLTSLDLPQCMEWIR